MRPSVAVVTLTLPERRGFLETLQKSAQAWTHQPDEWIVICDEKRDIGNARNDALYRAKSDVVVFVDDDDWQHPLRIEKQVAVLEGLPGGMVGTTNFYVHDTRTGKVTYSRTWGGATCFPASTMAFWREAALHIGFPPGLGAELAFQKEWERRTGERIVLKTDWWERRAGGFFMGPGGGRSCDMRDPSLFVLQRHEGNSSPEDWCVNLWEVSKDELQQTLGEVWFNR